MPKQSGKRCGLGPVKEAILALGAEWFATPRKKKDITPGTGSSQALQYALAELVGEGKLVKVSLPRGRVGFVWPSQ